MMRFATTASVIFAVTSFVACGGGASPSDIEDVRQGQKDILAKIADMEKTVERVKASGSAQGGIDPTKVYNIPIDQSLIRGPKDAKVTIVTFSDFQCPVSLMAHRMIRDVLKDYPTDVNFAYKEFPLTGVHPCALAAAKAALAAGKQGRFWEMHDMLYDFIPATNDLQPEGLMRYIRQNASTIGLDVERWEKDFNSPEIDEEVRKDVKDGQAIGVTGTPTVFIAGKQLQKASVEGFKEMIDAALKKDGKI
jgi:protein-disulfide isomerase